MDFPIRPVLNAVVATRVTLMSVWCPLDELQPLIEFTAKRHAAPSLPDFLLNRTAAGIIITEQYPQLHRLELPTTYRCRKAIASNLRRQCTALGLSETITLYEPNERSVHTALLSAVPIVQMTIEKLSGLRE